MPPLERIPERRLFFALWPDDAVRAQLAAAAGRWLGATGRRVPSGNLHATLAFLGNVAVDRVDGVHAAVAAVTAEPFELCIDRGGWWRRPRVAWLAPTRIPAALAALEAALWHALEPHGWHREFARFQPHVSVARRLRDAPAVAELDPIRWRCTDFVLCESVSTRDGVRYAVRARWPLSASPVV